MPGREKEECALMSALRVGRCKGELGKWGHGFVFLKSAMWKRLPINTFVAFRVGQVNEHCLVGGSNRMMSSVRTVKTECLRKK